MRACRRIIIIWIIVAAATEDSANAANPDQFLDFSMAGLPGRLHVPASYVPGQHRPVILFLHGGGEHGTDNLRQINGNIDLLLEASEIGGAFLYAPQSSSGVWASTGAASTDEIRSAVAMIDRAAQTYSIDRSRVYVTGLSSGGGGTWDVLAKHADLFAAGIPICGNFGATLFNETLPHKPIWAFHSQDDPIVPVARSRDMVNAIVSSKGHEPFTFALLEPRQGHLYADEPLRYMEGGSGGHEIWNAVYAYQPMRDWMFAQSLPEPGIGGMLMIVMLWMRRRKCVG